MLDESQPRPPGPSSLFQLFSWLFVMCGLLGLVFVVLRVFGGGYPSPPEIQFRWYLFGASLSTIWFGWLGLVVSAIRERLGDKPQK